MPNTLWPASRPKRGAEAVIAMLRSHGVQKRPALLGVRGYYRTTMGDPTANDRGFYDDAVFLVRPDGAVFSFNANTDPAIYRHGIATLAEGVWQYEVGLHRGKYLALRQATPVTVQRDSPHGPNHAPAHDVGMFGINIHRGGVTATHSEGCQTIVPHQYTEFMAAVVAAMVDANVVRIPYCLVEEPPANV